MTTTTTTPPLPPALVASTPLIVDRMLPRYDVDVARSIIVDASVHATFEAARRLDFMTVRDPVVDAAFWLRGLPARLRGNRPEPRPRLVLEEDSLPGWCVLGVEPDREIAFGAIGVFWKPEITWREDVGPEEFAGFDEPGYGKIAACFVVSPYGERHALLTYECRTAVTDAVSAAKFRRYWKALRPFIGYVLGHLAHHPRRRRAPRSGESGVAP